MKAFAELYARYPSVMFGLCLQECFDERRPVWFTQGIGFDDRCMFCERQTVFVWGLANSCYNPEPECVGGFPGNLRKRHCGREYCETLAKYYFNNPQSIGRRSSFKQFFGTTIGQIDDKVILSAALMGHMLRQIASQRTGERYVYGRKGRNKQHQPDERGTTGRPV